MAYRSVTIGLFSFLSFLGAVVLAGADSAQVLSPRKPGARVAEARPFLPIVFDGFVLEPDGAPAEGAVVTSSAGGKAITDPRGRYRLEADVPHAARFVQITAAGRTDANLSASTSFELGRASGVGRVDPLQLLPDTCQLGWVPTFRDQPGVGGTVYALLEFDDEFDDGNGPALHAGGGFTSAGSAELNHIARWNGVRWKALGSGLDGDVRALAVFDDGSGPALYAGGNFTSAGGAAASHVARWNGSSWSALGLGLDSSVHALAVFDDGSGPALFAGGWFSTAGGVPASHIAKWDGASWSALGSGTNSVVQALVAHDDGSGPALYAGGEFTTAGGLTARRIARWDGASWSALGSGLRTGTNDFAEATALIVHDDGSGPALYAGGEFATAGGVSTKRIARWNGSSWSGLGSGMNSSVTALVVYDDGSGPALHAGGYFSTAGGAAANQIAKWNGASWSALSAGMNNSVFALTTHDLGGGTALVAGGSFTAAGTAPATWVGTWDGSDWSAVGGVTNRLNDAVRAQIVHDDGSGPALYAGGEFTLGGGVARWDGTSWSALGTWIGGGTVHALTVYDDGSGPALYAGGEFTSAGGVAANRVARWDGTSWSTLGSGTDDRVSCLTAYDDGGGPELYAGGWFESAGGIIVNRIARWNGSSWTALNGGIQGFDVVFAMAVYDDGSGPALYVAIADGFISASIERWDGSSWSTLAVAEGFDGGIIHSLTVHDDGSGPALYAGGDFTAMGGVSAENIARWDGSSWSALGSGLDGGATALGAFDDGTGMALYAGGNFTSAGAIAANHVAKWDGSSWTPLGSGLSGSSGFDTVLSLVGVETGGLRGLYAGGAFTALDSGDSFLAKWGCVPVTRASKVRPR